MYVYLFREGKNCVHWSLVQSIGLGPIYMNLLFSLHLSLFGHYTPFSPERKHSHDTLHINWLEVLESNFRATDRLFVFRVRAWMACNMKGLFIIDEQVEEMKSVLKHDILMITGKAYKLSVEEKTASNEMENIDGWVFMDEKIHRCLLKIWRNE